MFRFYCLLAAFCLLTACATPGFEHSLDNPDWEISGKIGARENALRATSTLFQWRQQDDRYAIYLFNSLGQIQLSITGNNRRAMAQQPDGKTTMAKTPEALLESITGWYFPVSAARFWLQGQTQGSEEAIAYSGEGLLASFHTRQWQVTLENYKPVDGALLPHRLKLAQDRLQLTLVIKEHARFTP